MEKSDKGLIRQMTSHPGWKIWKKLKEEALENLLDSLGDPALDTKVADFTRGQINELRKDINLDRELADDLQPVIE